MTNQSASEKLAILPQTDRDAFINSLSKEEAAALMYDWRGFMARPDQIAPGGVWDIWLCLAGRGWGKTRTGAEWVKENVASGTAGRIALIAETAADARDVIVEGDSGILRCYTKADRPLYESSKRRLTWNNGATATLFNASEPDQLRGPQFDLAWCDELAKWRYARETWDMLQFGLRLGDHPKVLVTTTPRPIEVVRAIIAGQEGVVTTTRGNTMDNRSNLAGAFLTKIINRYKGTRLGRQELNAEILGDIPNALWTYAMIEISKVSVMPERLGRTVVAVDPAVTNTEDSDYHGIVVLALDESGREAYVLEDGSRKGSPLDWAKRAVSLYDKYEADAIIAEVNQGGDMVKANIRTVRSSIPVIEVRATRGKHVRAEPIASLYEQRKVHHVGTFDELEKQMTMMTTAGYEGEDSPDRCDALVWALTNLFPSIVSKPKPVIVPPAPRKNYWN